jgi:citrate lyase subunit beta / citryl-CoA lyase
MVKPVRTALYMPASNTRAIDKARGLNADAYVFDLEDAVAPAAKADARAQACAALAQGGFGTALRVVRVNSLTTPWFADDCAAVAKAQPEAVLLPKIETLSDVRQATAALATTGPNIPLWAMIETPRALLNLQEIAASGLIAALVFGAEDLMKDLRGRAMPGRENLFWAMSQLVMIARCYDLIALDGVFVNLSDNEGFERSCAQARDFGFDGKTLVHPSQIAPAQAAFRPSTKEVERARQLIAAFEAAQGGVTVLDGVMIEELHVAQARALLAEERG